MAEMGEGSVGHPGPEVATPAPHHRVEPEEQGIRGLVPSFAVALDAPTEKVEAQVDVGDQRLFRGQA